jgi:hypothetical protein
MILEKHFSYISADWALDKAHNLVVRKAHRRTASASDGWHPPLGAGSSIHREGSSSLLLRRERSSPPAALRTVPTVRTTLRSFLGRCVSLRRPISFDEHGRRFVCLFRPLVDWEFSCFDC